MNSLPRWSTHCDTLIPARVLSFVASQSNKGWWEKQPHRQINFRLCLPHRRCLHACFCWMKKNKHGHFCFFSPHYTKPASWKSSDSLSPDRWRWIAFFPICSYQPSLTQLPGGIFVTLHKIVMTSPSRWAPLLYFSLFSSPGTASPPSQHELIDALDA